MTDKEEIAMLRSALSEALEMLEIYYIPNANGSTPTITRIKTILQCRKEPWNKDD